MNGDPTEAGFERNKVYRKGRIEVYEKKRNLKIHEYRDSVNQYIDEERVRMGEDETREREIYKR